LTLKCFVLSSTGKNEVTIKDIFNIITWIKLNMIKC